MTELPYSEGEQTIAIEFSGSNGNLSVVYARRRLCWQRYGDWVDVQIDLAFTPTHTTASGNLRVPLPFTPNAFGGDTVIMPAWMSFFSKLNVATQFHIGGRIPNTASFMEFVFSNDAGTRSFVTHAEVTSGAALEISAGGRYKAVSP